MTTLSPGCYVDGSGERTTDCNMQIVAFADEQGFPLSTADRATMRMFEDDCWSFGDEMTLLYIADEAVEWLNEQLPEGYGDPLTWIIDSNSLLLVTPEYESV